MDFPIEIKVAQMEPRYDETRPRYEQLSETKQTVAVLSLRRNTLLAIVIIVICQLASVDNFNLLPAGILAYVVGAVGTVEAVAYWERQADEEVRQWNDRPLWTTRGNTMPHSLNTTSSEASPTFK
ncbi:expressed unknown protein [Seminavis robusta]|uniref:Uncharacterized protein n=1 Tax=Seminavis robusta TaxID=568900 RepID=A0A9N8HKQ0_9STRA|nr:expressed unknown protein [Seminavis robusta]|eukprot:Sro856_g211590.1 n/a (125) ;mRNA; r:26859-27233